MASKKVNARILPVVPKAVEMDALPLDTETKEDLGPKLISIRDVHSYANVPMSMYMESVWGAFTAIRTGTDIANSKVYLYRAEPGAPGSVPVTRGGTQNALSFSLFIPLQKLGIRPTADRQWDLIPTEQPILGGPPAFVLSMTERISVPRNLKAEEAEAAEAKRKEQLQKQIAATDAKIAREDAKWMAKVTGADVDEG